VGAMRVLVALRSRRRSTGLSACIAIDVDHFR
jgi:hypothetical protein